MKTHIKNPHFVLIGASPDTGNLGVSALSDSTLHALASSGVDQISVFDHGKGKRTAQRTVADRPLTVHHLGATPSLRVYRPESTWNIRLASMVGGTWNPAAQAIAECDAVLSLAGGDSFTDLYGARRFWTIVNPMLAAIHASKPLILLPQTYGPFTNPSHRKIASKIIRYASLAYARDERSFAALKDLAGPDLQSHLRSGVDMAFGLPVQSNPQIDETFAGFQDGTEKIETIGFNVSGLIYNDPSQNPKTFGIHCDYREIVDSFLRRILTQTDCRILLVPHVSPREDGVESDIRACHIVRNRLQSLGQNRILVAPAQPTASEAKALISRTDWFCGTRMHSTIASLSTGVPTAALAYSLKTQGVFETCGQGDAVVDLRSVETAEAGQLLWNIWENRQAARQSLAQNLASVQLRRNWQRMDLMNLGYALANPSTPIAQPRFKAVV